MGKAMSTRGSGVSLGHGSSICSASTPAVPEEVSCAHGEQTQGTILETWCSLMVGVRCAVSSPCLAEVSLQSYGDSSYLHSTDEDAKDRRGSQFWREWLRPCLVLCRESTQVEAAPCLQARVPCLGTMDTEGGCILCGGHPGH